jgi:hypothetical protein
MNLIIISKGLVHQFPIIISLAFTAKELGYDVEIITQNIAEETMHLLEHNAIKVSAIKNLRGTNRLSKILQGYKFAKFAKKCYLSANRNDKVWIAGVGTAVGIGIKTLKIREFYFQIHELYDRFPLYKWIIKKYIPYAKKIIVPEKNRAAIFQVWFNMRKQPSVLPNKPYFEENILNTEEEKYKKYIELIKKEKENGKIILLYQGHLSLDRDLSQLLLIANEMKNKLIVVLMGYKHLGILEKYKEICPSLIYVEPIPAPFHLSITKYADIGLLIYSPVSLNNIYCAPNKIWEYTQYGLSILGNNIIGLEYIETLSLGKIIDLNNDASICEALESLCVNSYIYKTNSLNFYSNYNLKHTVQLILNDGEV